MVDAVARAGIATSSGWRTLGLVMHYIGLLFPFLMIAVGAFFPELRIVVNTPVPLSWTFFWFTIAGIAWVINDLVLLARILLSGYRLIENAIVSVIVAMIMEWIVKDFLDKGTLTWSILIPGIAASIDALLSVYMAISQALKARVLQEERAVH